MNGVFVLGVCVGGCGGECVLLDGVCVCEWDARG